MKKVVFLSIVIMTMIGCSQSQKHVGIYTGTIPCADCEGIKVNITLKADNTYEKTVVYLGKGNGNEINTSGTYSVDKQDVITLNDISGEPNKYKIGENSITQLDMVGKSITGSLSEKYILPKNNCKAKNR